MISDFHAAIEPGEDLDDPEVVRLDGSVDAGDVVGDTTELVQRRPVPGDETEKFFLCVGTDAVGADDRLVSHEANTEQISSLRSSALTYRFGSPRKLSRARAGALPRSRRRGTRPR